jgi:hypothetical protein
MFALGGLMILLAIVGVALLAIKLLITLVFLPLKIGFGLLKVVLAVLVGIPLLICGAVFAAAVLPMFLIVAVLGLIALPFVAAAKIIF